MFRKMRREDRKIDKTEAIKILQNGEYGVLATLGKNNYPYTVPLSYIYNNNSIYFHCAVEGSKLDNIAHNDKVSFCVVGKTEILPDVFSTLYESTIVFGKAVEVDDEEKRFALKLLIEKYSPEYLDSGMQYINRALNKTKVIKIECENITGKARK